MRKAIDTLTIEKVNLEERIKGLTEEMKGLEDVISDKRSRANEYLLQVLELQAAIEAIESVKNEKIS